MEYFPQKQKGKRHKQLGYTDKLVTSYHTNLEALKFYFHVATLKSNNS